jgi:hypothetical protein
LVVGLQVFQFGILARLYTVTHRFAEHDPALEWLRGHFKVEYGLLLGIALFGIGFIVDGCVLVEWIYAQFGALERIRPALVATALMAMGVQMVFFSFLFGILDNGGNRKGNPDHASDASESESL